MRKPLLITAALLASVAAGCGSDKSTSVDEDQIRSVVREFAAADGPEACKLLSPEGLVNVYGGFSKPVAVARQNCLRRSKGFKGEQIQLQDIDVTDDANARIGALNEQGTIAYNVKLVRIGKNWRIEKITQSKVD